MIFSSTITGSRLRIRTGLEPVFVNSKEKLRFTFTLSDLSSVISPSTTLPLRDSVRWLLVETFMCAEQGDEMTLTRQISTQDKLTQCFLSIGFYLPRL